jgi:hypothetical protein
MLNEPWDVCADDGHGIGKLAMANFDLTPAPRARLPDKGAPPSVVRARENLLFSTLIISGRFLKSSA